MMRSFFTRRAALALTALVAGCAGYSVPPASTSAPAPSSSGGGAETAPAPLCNTQAAQFAVGKNSTGSVVESARVRSGAQMARIVRPGQMLTKEFDAQRLNLEVDGTGRIVAARCG